MAEPASFGGGYGDVVQPPARNCLPGWSLPREGPRAKKLYGCECPAPTVQDWEDYKEWQKFAGVNDYLPAAPQMFFADTSLLFVQDPDVKLPWIFRVKCELPRRVGRLSGDLPVRASYIGFGKSELDSDEGFELFKTAAAQIGVVLCRHIHYPPNRFEIAHLEQSDLILVDGGDRKKLWTTLGGDHTSSEIAEHVKWRYLQGAVVIGIGEAMSLLSEKSWFTTEKGTCVPFKGWKIFPHVVAPEGKGIDLEEMVTELGGPGVTIFGISPGGGMIFNKDGLVEPVRQVIQEYRYDYKTEGVKIAVLIGPPRGTGLMCPLHAARASAAEEDEEDTFAFCLTQEEEDEEEMVFQAFDAATAWLTPEVRAEVEEFKARANEAFKVRKASLAITVYLQAHVLLSSNECSWNCLPEDFRLQLDGKKVPTKQGKLSADANELQSSLGKKEEYESASLKLSLLLNLCAAYLMAFDQDEERSRVTVQKDNEDDTSLATAAGREDVTVADNELMIVEVRDNLVEAFRAANAALALTKGASAKAWFRRGCVFEKMRDPRNAVRDFEEALSRAPGDKPIMQRRNAAAEAASHVAENTFYARHKELDKEATRLDVDSRRALYLRSDDSDTFEDKRRQFSIFQPLARPVEGRLEEIDGKPQLVIADEPLSMEGSPYLHVHALWTWEDLLQRARGLQYFCIEGVDLGSGPLEWLCKGMRKHSELKVVKFLGCHLGSAAGKMLKNVLAQNTSLVEMCLDGCGLHDGGLAEIAAGLADHRGCLETLSLRRNFITHRQLGKLADVFCPPAKSAFDPKGDEEDDVKLSLTELDLSENVIGARGAKEIARIIGSDAHQLRIISLQDAFIDMTAFWRLVNKLSDTRLLAKLDLRYNPIGRGTRRIWRSTMGPTIRCDTVLTDHPLKKRKEAQKAQEAVEASGPRSFPNCSLWV
eukprot:TRINITY_DN50088_c0_g1_i1.p1 TRINITY_DN50088_c0_g1~~TRINITY_DN50088_c0_g1_i1.p1  ORF type:complete len:939 (-),score=205.92 TRINITY_DN50088_c0_g1_i1:19-2814(-)